MKNYQSINLNELKEPLVLVVDMVNGFIKEGSMSDINIMKIVPNIKTLISKVPSYFIADKHLKDAVEFNSFPEHCLDNHIESEIIDELKEFNTYYPTVYKNSTNAIHATNRDDVHNFNFNILDNYKSLIIVGCCTDICVMQLVLSLRTYYNEHNKQMNIYVPVNCVDTYNAIDYHDSQFYNEISLNLMEQSGAIIVSNIE